MPNTLSLALDKSAEQDPLARIGHDFLVGGITMAAIMLLVVTGTNWVRTLTDLTDVLRQSESLIVATLLLNIALILFGWRRYAELRSEVDRRIAAEQHALQLAHSDALTGLRNRRALSDEGEALVAKWRSKGLRPAALAIDIDAFKSINDMLGHAAGDAVIASVADTIRELAPQDSLIARVGGDEFVVLCGIEPNDDAKLNHFGRDVAAAMSISIPDDRGTAATSASVGGAVAGDETVSLDALLRFADTAMYRAKALGRSRYCRFDETMEATLARRDQIERALETALRTDELYTVYEPLVDLLSSEPIGYEMLARWTSATLGEIAPDEFISVAEEKGLISQVTDKIFATAFQHAAQWPHHLSLSLNASRSQMRDPWFAQKLLQTMDGAGFDPKRLIVEMTESAIADNVHQVHKTFEILRSRGVRMALDDFGTGFASLASLRSLAFDSIKIDREFISTMTQNPGADTVSAAVIQLGQSLGLPIIAEGIENRETIDRLIALSCPIGQGHYYGKSMSQADVMLRHTKASTTAH